MIAAEGNEYSKWNDVCSANQCLIALVVRIVKEASFFEPLRYRIFSDRHLLKKKKLINRNRMHLRRGIRRNVNVAAAISLLKSVCTVKFIRISIHRYVVARSPYFNETAVMWARASLFRRFTDTNVYEPVPLKYGKLATRYPWIYGYDFYSVSRHCRQRGNKSFARDGLAGC